MCLSLIPVFHWKACDLVSGLNSLSVGPTVLEFDDVSLWNFQVTDIALQIQNATGHQPRPVFSG